ncbi:MAG: VOC family protein [Ilumatobacteraceae bacterium]
MSNIYRIDAITLTARNMAESIGFYEALGFSLTFGGSDSDFSTLSATANGPHVNLIAVEPHNVAGTDWGRAIFHVDNVDALHRMAINAGLSPSTEPSNASWGERYFAIRDPSGNDLSFAKPLSDERDHDG